MQQVGSSPSACAARQVAFRKHPYLDLAAAGAARLGRSWWQCSIRLLMFLRGSTQGCLVGQRSCSEGQTLQQFSRAARSDELCAAITQYTPCQHSIYILCSRLASAYGDGRALTPSCVATGALWISHANHRLLSLAVRLSHPRYVQKEGISAASDDLHLTASFDSPPSTLHSFQYLDHFTCVSLGACVPPSTVVSAAGIRDIPLQRCCKLAPPMQSVCSRDAVRLRCPCWQGGWRCRYRSDSFLGCSARTAAAVCKPPQATDTCTET
jgi:hypothetical protein